MSFSISLSGRSFFLTGPRGVNDAYGCIHPLLKSFRLTLSSYAGEAAFRAAFSHPPNIHHTYIALGEDGAYFKSIFNAHNGDERDRKWHSSRVSNGSVYAKGLCCDSLGQHGFLQQLE
jgi:hypothetical protein